MIKCPDRCHKSTHLRNNYFFKWLRQLIYYHICLSKDMIDDILGSLVQPSANVFDDIGNLLRGLNISFQYLNYDLIVSFEDIFVETYLNC